MKEKLGLFDGQAHQDGFLVVEQGHPIHPERWMPGAGWNQACSSLHASSFMGELIRRCMIGLRLCKRFKVPENDPIGGRV